MYFSKKEKNIVKPFFDYIAQKRQSGEQYNMKWKNGTDVYAKIISIEDDDNDLDFCDEEYEEFWSVVILIEKLKFFNPLDGLKEEWLNEGELFDFNYHDFPYEIYNSKGELISKREI